METINFIDLGRSKCKIDDNKITQVKALGKLRWPFLRKLEISNVFYYVFRKQFHPTDGHFTNENEA